MTNLPSQLWLVNENYLYSHCFLLGRMEVDLTEIYVAKLVLQWGLSTSFVFLLLPGVLVSRMISKDTGVAFWEWNETSLQCGPPHKVSHMVWNSTFHKWKFSVHRAFFLFLLEGLQAFLKAVSEFERPNGIHLEAHLEGLEQQSPIFLAGQPGRGWDGGREEWNSAGAGVSMPSSIYASDAASVSVCHLWSPVLNRMLSGSRPRPRGGDPWFEGERGNGFIFIIYLYKLLLSETHPWILPWTPGTDLTKLNDNCLS